MPYYKILTSRIIHDTATSHVGKEGVLWLDPASKTIRVGDGVTPGGLVINANGTGQGSGGTTVPATLTKMIDEVSANLVYYGEAALGSLPAAAAWRIRKITYDDDGNVLSAIYAATGAFDQVWNNRYSLVYTE